MKYNKVLLLLLWLGCGVICRAEGLQEAIAARAKTFKATVGVAVLRDDKTIVLLNNNEHYPLMSVFKFHVAVAVLNKMAERQVSLQDSLAIRPEEIRADTYSPLREKVPRGKQFKLPFYTLLYYSIALSDNNACDILIRYVGGIANIRKFMWKLGLKGFQLTETEASMHSDLSNCYKNWSTPLAMMQCLKRVYEGTVLRGEYKQFLFDTMLNTTTGTDKIKAGLPVGTPFAHKTGSSDRLPSGVMIGDNDVGIVFLPGGKHYYIVIFLKNSEISLVENRHFMADISRIVYSYFTNCTRSMK